MVSKHETLGTTRNILDNILKNCEKNFYLFIYKFDLSASVLVRAREIAHGQKYLGTQRELMSC